MDAESRKRFGRWLEQARKQAGFTQEEVAAGAGVSHQAISRYEQEDCGPSVTTFFALIRCLGDDPLEVIERLQLWPKKAAALVGVARGQAAGGMASPRQMVEELLWHARTLLRVDGDIHQARRWGEEIRALLPALPLPELYGYPLREALQFQTLDLLVDVDTRAGDRGFDQAGQHSQEMKRLIEWKLVVPHGYPELDDLTALAHFRQADVYALQGAYRLALTETEEALEKPLTPLTHAETLRVKLSILRALGDESALYTTLQQAETLLLTLPAHCHPRWCLAQSIVTSWGYLQAPKTLERFDALYSDFHNAKRQGFHDHLSETLIDSRWAAASFRYPRQARALAHRAHQLAQTRYWRLAAECQHILTHT